MDIILTEKELKLLQEIVWAWEHENCFTTNPEDWSRDESTEDRDYTEGDFVYGTAMVSEAKIGLTRKLGLIFSED